MQQHPLDQQLKDLHGKVAASRGAPLEQAFFDDCAADAAAILARANDAEQTRYAIERIDKIFDQVGVDAKRLLSTGRRSNSTAIR